MQHFDVTGKRLILPGDIVIIPDPNLIFYGKCGLVLYTNNKNNNGGGEECCIPVLFDVEVSGQYDDWAAASRWARENWLKPRWPMIGNIELANSCPRVVRFKPEELQVIDEWNISDICIRGAGSEGLCETYTVISDKPFISGAYPCFLPGCENVATEIAFPNCLGSMDIAYTCRDCYSKMHGIRGNSCPDMKRPLPERFPYSPFPKGS